MQPRHRRVRPVGGPVVEVQHAVQAGDAHQAQRRQRHVPQHQLAPGPLRPPVGADEHAEAGGVGDDDAREAGVFETWTVQHLKTDDRLVVSIHEVLHDTEHELGVDPGLVKDGVEAHLQVMLAAQIELLGTGHSLVRREYPTAIGPVDILARDASGGTVAVEIKRRGDIDGVEQLTRYLELLNRDPHLAPVRGVFAAQEIKPQARVLAHDRGIGCLVLDYDAMRGHDDVDSRLF